MKTNFKVIHIGSFIRKRIDELNLKEDRLLNFFNCTSENLERMYEAQSLDTEILLKWSKILEYDFFRIYTQHLILYAPPAKEEDNTSNEVKTLMPQFRKNIYTKEIIEFILDLVSKGEKTKAEVIREYRIPKTTLYKWIEKYQS